MGGRKISKVTELTLWDGESYERFRYGHFCTLRCAEHFANDAVKAGYRRAPMTNFLLFVLELIVCFAFFGALMLTVLLIGLITGTV